MTERRITPGALIGGAALAGCLFLLERGLDADGLKAVLCDGVLAAILGSMAAIGTLWLLEEKPRHWSFGLSLLVGGLLAGWASTVALNHLTIGPPTDVQGKVVSAHRHTEGKSRSRHVRVAVDTPEGHYVADLPENALQEGQPVVVSLSHGLIYTRVNSIKPL